jgi:hypothetical protein
MVGHQRAITAVITAVNTIKHSGSRPMFCGCSPWAALTQQAQIAAMASVSTVQEHYNYEPKGTRAGLGRQGLTRAHVKRAGGGPTAPPACRRSLCLTPPPLLLLLVPFRLSPRPAFSTSSCQGWASWPSGCCRAGACCRPQVLGMEEARGRGYAAGACCCACLCERETWNGMHTRSSERHTRPQDTGHRPTPAHSWLLLMV